MCTAPRARCEKLGDTFVNKEGKISHNYDWLSWEEVEQAPEYYKAKYHRVQMCPCGQCKECRLEYAKKWANLLMLEKQYWPDEECWFLTLTYDDLHIPTHTTVNTETGEIVEGLSLKKEDLSKFIKDIRNKYSYIYKKQGKKFEGMKFYGAGEYGSTTGRPHMHVIIYGLPLDQSKLKIWKHNDFNQPIWTHEDLDEIWEKGSVKVGRVTWESCGYTARYNVKKLTGEIGKAFYAAQGKIPEFVNMSRRPGIGHKYFDEHKDEIYQTDSIFLANKSYVMEIIPPRQFDKLMEKLEPDIMQDIKKKRRLNAEKSQYFRNLQTDLTRAEQRAIKNEKLIEREKLLIRKEI